MSLLQRRSFFGATSIQSYLLLHRQCLLGVLILLPWVQACGGGRRARSLFVGEAGGGAGRGRRLLVVRPWVRGAHSRCSAGRLLGLDGDLRRGVGLLHQGDHATFRVTGALATRLLLVLFGAAERRVPLVLPVHSDAGLAG